MRGTAVGQKLWKPTSGARKWYHDETMARKGFLVRPACRLVICMFIAFCSWVAGKSVKLTLANKTLIRAIETRQNETAVLALRNGADPNSYEAIGDTDASLIARILRLSAANRARVPAIVLVMRTLGTHFPEAHNVPNHEYRSVIGALLKSGARPDSIDDKGYTALMLASARGDEVVVNMLLNHHANADLAAVSGATSLMLACEGENTSVIRVLIAHGARVDATNSDGDTALHYAAQRGNGAAARILIRAGANIWTKNTLGVSALDVARDREYRFEVRSAIESTMLRQHRPVPITSAALKAILDE